MKKSERQLLEAAAKILRGKYALNEAQAPDDFEGEYDDEKSPSTLELISKRKGLRGKQEESTELEEAVSGEVENILDSISELPESDMKDFLYGMYKVFKEKARAEKNADKKEVYNKIIPLFDSAWITWSQADLNEANDREARFKLVERAQAALEIVYSQLEDFVTSKVQGEKNKDLITAFENTISYLNTQSSYNDIIDDVRNDIKYRK